MDLTCDDGNADIGAVKNDTKWESDSCVMPDADFEKMVRRRRRINNAIDVSVFVLCGAMCAMLGYSYGKGLGFRSGLETGTELGRVYERAEIFDEVMGRAFDK